MKKLFFITALIFAVSSLHGCGDGGGKTNAQKKKELDEWDKKGTYTVNPKIGKLH